MDFGVLGPLLVVIGGVATPIRPRKHRILLASLLLRVNRPVHIEELVDRLWPVSPPAGAWRTVQTYAMRLRRELGAAADHMHTCPEGYAIMLAPEQLDLERFVQLTELAETALRNSTLVDASGLLRRALAQWRGAPLADVPSAMLACTEVPRLVELRRRATERRIELDLELGATAELVSELRTLTVEYPLCERFWVLLMRALWHDGRGAEALAVYHEVCRLLGEQLGVDPGHELRRLHLEILTGTVGRDPGRRRPVADPSPSRPTLELSPSTGPER